MSLKLAPERPPAEYLVFFTCMWAGGVLPVSVRDDGVAVMLLGRDSREKGGRWSDFAGGGEAQDASPRHTAIRELAEETGGALTMRPSDLDSCMEFRGTTPSGKVLHRYVVRIPYDPHLPGTFVSAKDDEKIALGWFPLASPPPLRRVFAMQMRRDAPAIQQFVTR